MSHWKNIIKNSFWLYFVQILRLVFPLLFLPFLARVFTKEQFGVFLYSQTYAIWLAMLAEYGFNISATRAISQTLHKKNHIVNFISKVQSAKIVLSVITFVLTLILCLTVNPFKENSALFIISWLFSMATAFMPVYYFQSVEKIRPIALLDGISMLAGGVFLFLISSYSPSPDKAMFALAITRVAGSIIANAILYTIQPFSFSLMHAIKGLKDGIGIFIFQSSVSLYTTVTSLIVGLVLPSFFVAQYVAADRLAKGALTLIFPFIQATIPRINKLVVSSSSDVKRMQITILSILVVLCVIGSCIAYFISDVLIRFVYGEGFGLARDVLRILIFLFPFSAISSVLSFHYLLPLKKDKLFNMVILTAGIINVLLVAFSSSFFGVIGVAFSVVFIEMFVSVCLLICVFICNKNDIVK